LSRLLSESGAWLPTTGILASVTAIGIALLRWLHAPADEPLLELIRPPVWGAVAVLLAGVVSMIVDHIARVRATRGAG